YDSGTKEQPGGFGGTTCVLYNPRTRKVDQHILSLAGTEWNCAGGITPWGSWISCEETVHTSIHGYSKDHGYNFEVPASLDLGLVNPIPLKEMGRFRHEAIAVDPRSGIVYQTEDRHDGLIYRFIPRKSGNLKAGGRLQALCIRHHKSMDTRNWRDKSRRNIHKMPISKWIQTSWVTIENVESPDDSLRKQGLVKGAAVFARSEGMWYGNNSIYWACTNGGPFMKGQIFRYIPSPFEGTLRERSKPGRVQLYIESHSAKILENCDNLTVSPLGDLFICEDHSGSCAIVRVTKRGEISKFAENHYSSSELAGACFSPDGNTFFVNLQNDGLTLAIEGPWKS
ncbi:MAG: alkaline phosphatase PhoX, partial [Bacteroidota bacterium]